MREIVPRNSELVGVFPNDAYPTHYSEHKGLVIDMRTEGERNTKEVVPYRVRRPNATFLGSVAASSIGINVVAERIVDVPLSVQNVATVAAFGIIFAKYIRDSKEHDKLELQKRQKRNDDIYTLAITDPNIYHIPSVPVGFRVEEGEEVNDTLQELLRTPAGRDLLESMSVKVDVSTGITAKESQLRQQIDKLQISRLKATPSNDIQPIDNDDAYYTEEAIHVLTTQLHRVNYSYKYGENYGSDITMELTFDPANAVSDTLNCAVNKGQLISDAMTQVQGVALLAQRYEILNNTLRDIPYYDRQLHKEAVAEIEKQKKELGLQILTEIARIKKIVLDQQGALLQGYADGTLS